MIAAEVRLVADAPATPATPATPPAPSQTPTLPAPEVAYLNGIARQIELFARTYAPRNTTALRMAEEAAFDIRRMAVAANVPGGERVAADIVPVVQDEPAPGTARGL